MKFVEELSESSIIDHYQYIKKGKIHHLLPILGIATILRVTNLGVSVRPDEPVSVYEFGQIPVGQIVVRISELDPHPPLYYILLRIWMEVIGHSIVIARLLSVLMGLVAVVGMYLLGREFGSHRIGLTAALIVTFSPFHIANAQTARMYPLFTSAILFSTMFLMRLSFNRAESKRDWIGYILSTGVLISTHLYGIFVFGGQILSHIILWRLSFGKKKFFRQFKRSGRWFGGALLISLPTIAIMFRTVLLRIQTGGGDVSHANPPTLKYLALTAGLFAGGESGLIPAALLLLVASALTLRQITEFPVRSLLPLGIAIGTVVPPVLISFILFSIWDGRSALGAWLMVELLSAAGYWIFSKRVRYFFAGLWAVATIALMATYYNI